MEYLAGHSEKVQADISRYFGEFLEQRLIRDSYSRPLEEVNEAFQRSSGCHPGKVLNDILMKFW